MWIEFPLFLRLCICWPILKLNSPTFALKTSESRLSDEVCSQTRGESSGNRFTVHTVMNLIVFLQHCSKRSFSVHRSRKHISCELSSEKLRVSFKHYQKTKRAEPMLLNIDSRLEFIGFLSLFSKVTAMHSNNLFL